MYINKSFILILILLSVPFQLGQCTEKTAEKESERSELILILDKADSLEQSKDSPVTSDHLNSYSEQTAYYVQHLQDEIASKKSEQLHITKDPRIKDLEKSVTKINVYQELNSRDNPKNMASLYLNLKPVNIWEGEWVKNCPCRYPFRFCHLPLYYEEINLERCGRGYGCLQPVMSSAHFLKTTVCLPVEMIFDPPCELVQSRGDCLSCQKFSDSHH